MTLKQAENQSESLCCMSEEIFQLYSTLTAASKEKVTRLIETLLNQQSDDQQSSDSLS